MLIKIFTLFLFKTEYKDVIFWKLSGSFGSKWTLVLTL